MWNEVIGSGPVLASSSSYREYSFIGRIEMEWPLESNTTNVIADYTVFTSIAPGEVMLPDATKGSPGVIGEFSNDGQGDLIILTKTGAEVTTISPGQTHRIILRSNSTEGGLWRSFVAGAGSSQVNAGALASPTIISQSGALVQAVPVIDAASNYTVSTGERGHLVNWTGGVGSLTLDLASEIGTGYFVHVRNSGEGALTILPQPPNKVDGIGETTLNPGQSCIVVCDGSNYFTISRSSSGAGGGSSPATFSYVTIDISGDGLRNLDSEEANNIAFRFIGTLTGDRTIIVPPSLAQYWVRNQTSGAFTLTITTQSAIDGARPGVAIPSNGTKILYSTGADVVDAANTNLSTPIAITEGGTGATSASAARINLGFTSVGNELATAASQQAARTAIGALAATNPQVTGNLLFDASGNGVTLSGGGKLYDDASTVQATVLRTNVNKRLSIRSDDGGTEYARLDGAANSFKVRGGDVLVSGGSAPNVSSFMASLMPSGTRESVRNALFNDVAQYTMRSVHTLHQNHGAGVGTDNTTYMYSKSEAFYFPNGLPANSFVLIMGKTLVTTDHNTSTGNIGGVCSLEALSTSGAWGGISTESNRIGRGYVQSTVEHFAWIHTSNYASGTPLRVAWSSVGGLFWVYWTNLIAITFKDARIA